jgi:hypothetical protein
MTTSKRDSHDKARRAGSQPNLGQKLTGENRGSGWIDTTGESVKRAKARLVARIPSDRKRLGHDLETITLFSTPAMVLTRLRRRSDPPDAHKCQHRASRFWNAQKSVRSR